MALLALGLLLGGTRAAQALNLTALYRGACQRSLGVVLAVTEDKLTLLNLEGRFEEVRRLDVIYLAQYPLGELPAPATEAPTLAPLSVKTLHQGKLDVLVEGWPIDFSEEEISFLTLTGQEAVIRKEAIWDLLPVEQAGPLQLGKPTGEPPWFAHPYPFAHCPAPPNGKQVFPQLLLGDPLLIRRELDRLQKGGQLVEDYRKDKVFYALPQVYGNLNSLGLWFSAGSRYGSSRSRVNSFIPSFVSELSEGPFGYQRVLVTGTQPMPYSLHEEPQSQFYYALKADYVHFSLMYDFDRLLLGEQRYSWKREDLDRVDVRLNELQHLMAGFDYHSWALEYMWMPLQYGVNLNEAFFRHRVELNKMALSYMDPHFRGELQVGWSVDGKVDNIVITEADSPEQIAEKQRLRAQIAAAPQFLTRIRFYRFNLDLHENLPFEPQVSWIRRQIDFSRGAEANDLEPAMRLWSQSDTLCLWLRWRLPLDLSLSGFASLEQQRRKWGETSLDQSDRRLLPKGGAKLDLTF